MTTSLPTYPIFSPIDGPEDAVRWSEWLTGFEAMLKAMQVEKELDDKGKFRYFNHYIGTAARKILKRQDDNGVTEMKFSLAAKALSNHFSPKVKRIYIMHMIHQEKQKPRESMS